jgi:hypothetical protein
MLIHRRPHQAELRIAGPLQPCRRRTHALLYVRTYALPLSLRFNLPVLFRETGEATARKLVKAGRLVTGVSGMACGETKARRRGQEMP